MAQKVNPQSLLDQIKSIVALGTYLNWLKAFFSAVLFPSTLLPTSTAFHG
jgi:hypothetical protein